MLAPAGGFDSEYVKVCGGASGSVAVLVTTSVVISSIVRLACAGNVGGVFDALTVTVKLHMPMFPAVSVALQVTVVNPSGKTDPDGGEVLLDTRPQLSLNTAAG